jgi:hypothetical protein
MFNQLKPAHALFVIALAYDLNVARINKKRQQRLTEQNALLNAYTAHLEKQIDYLTSKLDEHDVPVTEFDKIVMNTNLTM